MKFNLNIMAILQIAGILVMFQGLLPIPRKDIVIMFIPLTQSTQIFLAILIGGLIYYLSVEGMKEQIKIELRKKK